MEQESDQMPIAFSLSMIENICAMNAFAGMTEEQRRDVINEARNVKSKDEMEQLVEKIGTFPL
jgi:translation elongation factor EF-1beta